MKLSFQHQRRFQVGIMLLIVLVAIVWNNISSSRNLDQVDTSVTSIYNDRLMAATYIFDLSSNLYEKSSAHHAGDQAKQARIDRNISLLIQKYETTILTKQEAKLWRSFKENLFQYNAAADRQQPEMASFEKAVLDLKSLSSIQASEGNSLFLGTKASIASSTLSSYMEMALAIALGIITLILIGISRESVWLFKQRPSLN